MPGCQTWGHTPEEACPGVGAWAGHLEALADDGDPIPEPTGHTGLGRNHDDLAEMGVEPPEGTLMQLVPAPELDLAGARFALF